MKKSSALTLSAVVVFLASQAWSQSLADASKAACQQQKPTATKVYTEDDLPSVPASRMAEESHAAEATASNAEATPEATPAESSANSGDEAKTATSTSSAEKKDVTKTKVESAGEAEEWKSKVGEQDDQVKQLEKELDLMQRENKLRQASYYGDAGNQLRDQKKWADEQRTYQTDIEAKQKALADAKQKLDDTREQARKSGVPSGQIE